MPRQSSKEEEIMNSSEMLGEPSQKRQRRSSAKTVVFFQTKNEAERFRKLKGLKTLQKGLEDGQSMLYIRPLFPPDPYLLLYTTKE